MVNQRLKLQEWDDPSKKEIVSVETATELIPIYGSFIAGKDTFLYFYNKDYVSGSVMVAATAVSLLGDAAIFFPGVGFAVKAATAPIERALGIAAAKKAVSSLAKKMLITKAGALVGRKAGEKGAEEIPREVIDIAGEQLSQGAEKAAKKALDSGAPESAARKAAQSSLPEPAVREAIEGAHREVALRQALQKLAPELLRKEAADAADVYVIGGLESYIVSPDGRKKLSGLAARYASELQRSYFRDRAPGFEILGDELKQSMRKALEPVWQELSQKTGRNIFSESDKVKLLNEAYLRAQKLIIGISEHFSNPAVLSHLEKLSPEARLRYIRKETQRIYSSIGGQAALEFGEKAGAVTLKKAGEEAAEAVAPGLGIKAGERGPFAKRIFTDRPFHRGRAIWEEWQAARAADLGSYGKIKFGHGRFSGLPEFGIPMGLEFVGGLPRAGLKVAQLEVTGAGGGLGTLVHGASDFVRDSAPWIYARRRILTCTPVSRIAGQDISKGFSSIYQQLESLLPRIGTGEIELEYMGKKQKLAALVPDAKKRRKFEENLRSEMRSGSIANPSALMERLSGLLENETRPFSAWLSLSRSSILDGSFQLGNGQAVSDILGRATGQDVIERLNATTSTDLRIEEFRKIVRLAVEGVNREAEKGNAGETAGQGGAKPRF